MKTKMTSKKIAGLILIVMTLLAIVGIFPAEVNAAVAETDVAKIGETGYATLAEAVEAVPANGTKTTITLLKDVTNGIGFKVKAGQNMVIDFGGHTYDALNSLVGSTGTETNGCQLLKDSTVVMQNGTFKSSSTKVYMVIQNYSNLTLKDMTIDATTGSADYALSSNCGKVNIIGNTTIKSNDRAFDMCWAPSKNYPEGTQITVDTTGTISGVIELDVWGTFSDTNGIKSTLNIKNINHVGKFVVDSKLAKQMTITGGTFSEDVTAYVKEGYVAEKNSNGKYVVKIDEGEIVPSVPKLDTTDDTTISAGISEEAKKEVETIIVADAVKKEEIKELIDEGKEITVQVAIDKVEAGNKPSAEMIKIENSMKKDEKIAQYFDISVLVKADGKKVGELEELSNKITLSVVIPNELIVEGREFYILREHDGKVERLATTLDGNVLEFKTDKFSTYALTYADPADVVEDNKENNKEEIKNPQTSDNILTSIAVGLVGIVTIAGIAIYKKQK